MNIAKIDYKGGILRWNCFDGDPDIKSEDLIYVEYPDCLLDVSWYGDHSNMHGSYVISIIIRSTQISEETPYEYDWGRPYASIPCSDIDDMYVQLQRAIDIYPDQTTRYYGKKLEK